MRLKPGSQAQTSKGLSWIVVRGVVINADIRVTSIETNVVRTAETDSNGRYSVPALSPGKYTVAASQSGFSTQVREDVNLFLGESVRIDFTLSIAPTTQTVMVTGEVPAVQTSRTELSLIVNQQQIDLPINGRNFISFSVIMPGVSTDRTPQQGPTLTSGLSFARRQRGRSNNIMVDGLDNNDLVVGAVRSSFSQEAIREFQVLANSYSAEFGRRQVALSIS